MRAIEIGAFEAKSKFAELLEKVARGHEFLITKRGRPVARLVGQESEVPARNGRQRAWDLYLKIQKGGRKIGARELDDLVRESRRELERRARKLSD